MKLKDEYYIFAWVISMIGMAIAAILLSTACSAVVPDRILVSGGPYPEAVQAIEDFSALWDETFDEDPWPYLSDLNIQFYKKTEEEWNTPGCIRGQTNPYTYADIQVAYQEGMELGHTAIFHEPVHIVLYWTTGRPGYSHGLDGEGPWNSSHDALVRTLKETYR